MADEKEALLCPELVSHVFIAYSFFSHFLSVYCSFFIIVVTILKAPKRKTNHHNHDVCYLLQRCPFIRTPSNSVKCVMSEENIIDGVL